MKSGERVRERVTAALEDRLFSVRDEHALDRQVEQRFQRPPPPGVSRSLRQPAHDLGAAGGGDGR